MARKLAAAAALIASAAAVTLAGGSPSAAQESQTLTLRLKTVGAQPISHGKPKGNKVPTGDGIALRLAAFNENDKKVGTAYIECTNVGKPAAALKAPNQCVQTYVLGNDQIVLAGVVRFAKLASSKIPIVGGSGKYAGASGQVTQGKPVKGYDSIDVIELAG